MSLIHDALKKAEIEKRYISGRAGRQLLRTTYSIIEGAIAIIPKDKGYIKRDVKNKDFSKVFFCPEEV